MHKMFKIKKTLTGILVTLSLLVGAVTPLMPAFGGYTYAAPDCGSEKCTDGVPSDCGVDPVTKSDTHVNCSATSIKNNRIVKDVINPAIKIFSILVGVVAVIMLIIAGIIYGSAGDDPSRIKLAKKMIVDVVIGVIAYALLLAFMNYIIPQGISHKV